MSYQRPRSAHEIEEINTLLASNQRIPFYQSLTAKRMTTHYLSTFGSILDWSSIGQVRPLFSKEAFTYNTSYTRNFSFDNFGFVQNHYVRQTLLYHYPELEAQLDYLALRTKNQPFLVKV